jgi:hypothetical protein
MKPEILNLYMPFAKIAEAALRDDPSPEVVPGDIPPEPPQPITPLRHALKQFPTIAAGTGLGVALGMGTGLLYDKLVPKGSQFISPATIGTVAALAGGGAGIAAKMKWDQRTQELNRAKQEYENYLSRRAGSLPNPTVQPPPVR